MPPSAYPQLLPEVSQAAGMNRTNCCTNTPDVENYFPVLFTVAIYVGLPASSNLAKLITEVKIVHPSHEPIFVYITLE